MASDVAQRIAVIQEQIATAARRAGRQPDEVTLIGVCKTVSRSVVDEAYAAGLRHFGENRVQVAKEKFAASRPADLVLHLIGSLQTNKAKDAVALFDTVHSLDRPAIVEALGTRAEQAGKHLPVLIEVNITGEASKQGANPADVRALVELIARYPALEPRGLMAMAPQVADQEETRPAFRALRELRDALRRDYARLDLPDLSMGMTDDYPVAVEEGATLVRVGRAIFAEDAR